MHFHFKLATLACVLGFSYAQIYVPPEVEALAAAAVEEFGNYTDYVAPRVSSAPAPASNLRVAAAAASCSYWMESIRHQGRAAFNANPGSYQVFRNVKDFGARGDGVTDDTAAINAAITSGNRCAPGSCGSTTTTPAVVYFPAGTYMISSSIIQYYYTQMIGNPNCLPTIKAFSTFQTSNIGLIDSNPYVAGGNLGYGSTNMFWRQIRNLIIDTTLVPASASVTGIHWPTAQATSLENIVFNMNANSGTQHQGVFIESGSGGFVGGLTFRGGRFGLNVGNQQFTMRNLTFSGVNTAINQIWDWGWTYKSLNIINCSVGIDFSNGGRTALSVGSVTVIDSSFVNTPVAMITGRDSGSQPPAAGSVYLENLRFTNVATALRGNNGPLIGRVSSIAAYVSGNAYTPNGPNRVNGTVAATSRPSNLLQSDGKFYERGKPQYEGLPLSSFLSARTLGARGDGTTDDTRALQSAITQARSEGKVLYIDHGNYLVSNTIYIPAGSRIVGETYSVIMSTGAFFNNLANPKPVVQIGRPGETGSIEWSDTIVSTKGQQRGAILFEYNLAAPAGNPAGLWDVHARIGGFTGSLLRLSQCAKTPGTTITSSNLNQNCISGFLTMHITKQSAGLYLENVWLWVADHDIEDNSLGQITIYAGRGLLDESVNGPVWFVGTGVEHHVRYEYQFVNAKNVFQGQIQTETAYYQPNPNARIPFPFNSTWFDPSWGPDFVNDGSITNIPAADGWGLRILNSQNILSYGAGLYSFFDNYSTNCSNQGNGVRCQNRITSIEGNSSNIAIYNLNTVGTHWPITVGGQNVAYWQDNQNGFVQTVAMFRR